MNEKEVGAIRKAAVRLKQEIYREATAIGAEVDREVGGRFEVLQVVAPPGFLWNDGGSKCLKAEWTYGDLADRAGAFEDVLNRIRQGVRPVTPQEQIEGHEG